MARFVEDGSNGSGGLESSRPTPVRSGARVNLFGGPTVLLDGRRVDLSAMQKCLVAVVFAECADEENASVSRQELARLLWGKDSPKARHRLSQLIYELGKKCGGSGVLSVTSQHVVVGPHVDAGDWAEARRALAEGDHAAVVALLERGFLSRISETPSRAFEEWYDRRIARFERDLRQCAEECWHQSVEAHAWGQAFGAAGLLLRLDPYSEDALQRALLSGGMVGRVGEAMATYDEFSSRQASERNEWRPREETRSLLERLESLTTLPFQPARKPNQQIEIEPPFFGRDDELSELNQILSLTSPDDSIDAIAITGEGGIGKTRLAGEAARAARLLGYTVLEGASSEFERDIPLNPILEALSHDRATGAISGIGDPWRSVLVNLIPGLLRRGEPLPEVPYLNPGQLPRRTYEAIALLLEAVAESGPLLLFLDDFQWADDTSIAAIEFLRRRWSGGRLVLIVAIRHDGRVDGTKASSLVTTMDGANTGKVIRLAELGEEATSQLIGALARDVLSERQQVRIAQLSGRIPFFAVELTSDLKTAELVSSIEEGASPRIPVSIRQLLDMVRLTGLRPQSVRKRARWEWIVEAWLQTEQEAGKVRLDPAPPASLTDSLRRTDIGTERPGRKQDGSAQARSRPRRRRHAVI